MSITQQDIAKQLGISQRSVSVAFGGAGRIGEKTRQAILKAAEAHGYRPNRLASSLRTGQSGSIGVVWAFVNPWTGDSEIGMNLLQRIQNRGLTTYQVQHGDNRDVEMLRQRLTELRSRRVDAVVIEGTPSELMDEGVLDQLRDVPAVAVCREDLPDFPGDLVIHDRFQAIGEVVDHFVASGRSRLAMAISLDEESNPGKMAAFRRRCREHGLPEHDAELIPLDFPESPRNHGERHGLAMRRKFPVDRDLGGVDAIFAFNDVGAMYIIKDLKRRGLRVPEDVAVVGFNNTEPAAVWDPPLASGDRRFDEVASNVEALLVGRLGNIHRPPQRITIPMRFIHRASAG